jgi:hypothetical protein
MGQKLTFARGWNVRLVPIAFRPARIFRIRIHDQLDRGMAFSAMQPKRSLEEFLNTICHKRTLSALESGANRPLNGSGKEMSIARAIAS